MNIGWEKQIKKELTEEINAVDFPDGAQEKVLAGVYQQLRKRRIIMKKNRKHTGVILAAALVIIGSITAIGAGRIAYYSSSHYRNDETTDIRQLEEEAKARLGQKVNIPKDLAEGITFISGYVMDVEAWDEEGNNVGSFPEVNASYQEKDISLAISKPMEGAAEENSADIAETYQGIAISASVDQYLFLPPDQQPSAEDQALEAQGKLFISYGSSEVERKSFKNVSWNNDGLHYLIHTFNDVEVSELVEMAQNVIDYGMQ